MQGESKSRQRIQKIVCVTNFSRGTEKLLDSGNQHVLAWSSDNAVHAQTCVERYCKLANQRIEQFQKVSALCIDDHQFKPEELEQS